MPYIKEQDKPKFETAITEIVADLLNDYQPGELTYVLYVIARRVAMNNRRYGHLSQVRASIQDAADEFYRRIMAEYEDEKIVQNGDAL